MKTFLRTVLLGMAIVGATGCNSMSSDALQTIKLAVSGPESIVTIDRVKAVNGSVLVARLGAAEAMLVANNASGVVEWYGVTEMLLTQNGRVIQSAGLPFDVISPLAADDPFRNGLLSVTDGVEVNRLVDYPAQYLTGLQQNARYQRGPIETVKIMGEDLQLQRIDERVRIAALNFTATNRYWLEPESGLVRRSVQHISPDLPPLYLTLVQTAGGQP